MIPAAAPTIWGPEVVPVELNHFENPVLAYMAAEEPDFQAALARWAVDYGDESAAAMRAICKQGANREDGWDGIFHHRPDPHACDWVARVARIVDERAQYGATEPIPDSYPVPDETAKPSEARAEGIEALVVADIAARQQQGVAKYGQQLAHAGLTERELLQHAYGRALDLAIYLKGKLAKIEG
tara:strand:+ start:14342 stop:14893 length:552 start_codon:yes stop_codon:yes gene_type:complete